MMEEVRQNSHGFQASLPKWANRFRTASITCCQARAQIAIKLFGPDLATLRNKAGEIRDAMSGVPGIVDLLVEPQVGVPQVQINMDRQAAAAVGLTAKQLAETVDGAFNGHAASRFLKSSALTTCWSGSTIQRVSQQKRSVTRSSMRQLA